MKRMTWRCSGRLIGLSVGYPIVLSARLSVVGLSDRVIGRLFSQIAIQIVKQISGSSR
jgi:hypothetical protein